MTNALDLKKMVCENCGGSIDRRTMTCPYCGTQYERKHNGIEIRYIVDRPGVHTLRAEVKLSDSMVRYDQEQATAYALDKLRNEVADGLLAYMKITTSQDYDLLERCQIIRGEIKVIDPTFN